MCSSAFFPKQLLTLGFFFSIPLRNLKVGNRLFFAVTAVLKSSQVNTLVISILIGTRQSLLPYRMLKGSMHKRWL